MEAKIEILPNFVFQTASCLRQIKAVVLPGMDSDQTQQERELFLRGLLDLDDLGVVGHEPRLIFDGSGQIGWVLAQIS